MNMKRFVMSKEVTEKELTEIEKKKQELKDREAISKKAQKEIEYKETKEEYSDDDKSLKVKIKREKEKMAQMTFNQKLKYFAAYYLKWTIVIVAALVCGIYFLFNNVIFPKNVISSGCGVNVFFTEELKNTLTTGYKDYLGDTNKRDVSIITDELFNNFGGETQKLDGYSVEMVLYSQVAVGDINYFVINDNGYQWLKNQELCVTLDDVLSEETMKRLSEKDAIINDDIIINEKIENKNVAISLNKLGLFDEEDSTAYLLFTIASPSEGYEESYTQYLLDCSDKN